MTRDVERFNRWAPTYDRHYLQRLIFEPVQKTVLELAAAQVPQPEAILDIGCGTGRLLRAASERFPSARLEGVDAAEGMIEQARTALPSGSRILFQRATAENLPFGGAEFDLVFSTMTFHHWADQAKGIGEVSRVIKPTGRWLLADLIPTGWLRWVRRLLPLKHFLERVELESMLRPAGLSILAERRVQGRILVLAIGRALQTPEA
jgi:ubiquinone/menaquinone biosynthesis C-methylase UbiE